MHVLTYSHLRLTPDLSVLLSLRTYSLTHLLSLTSYLRRTQKQFAPVDRPAAVEVCCRAVSGPGWVFD